MHITNFLFLLNINIMHTVLIYTCIFIDKIRIYFCHIDISISLQCILLTTLLHHDLFFISSTTCMHTFLFPIHWFDSTAPLIQIKVISILLPLVIPIFILLKIINSIVTKVVALEWILPVRASNVRGHDDDGRSIATSTALVELAFVAAAAHAAAEEVIKATLCLAWTASCTAVTQANGIVESPQHNKNHATKRRPTNPGVVGKFKDD